MRYFKLPDLGEGLHEAEIVQWHVQEGDTVSLEQPLVSVETAKAIVEIPAPQAGKIAACFGKVGDLIHVGEPLVEFAGAAQEDTGTVVGEIRSRPEKVQEDRFIIGSADSRTGGVKATPAVRALARRLEVELETVTPSGRDGQVTPEDVERAARLGSEKGHPEPLRGVRRAMAQTMTRAHAEVVPVSVFEDADIHDWPPGTDITMRLVRAIASACTAEPDLNVWFDGKTLTRRFPDTIDLGIAVDTPDGLFVPVLRNISGRSVEDLRSGLERLRADVRNRSIPPEELRGATFLLSNFGMIAGKHATPVVVPPTVAILGAGAFREQVVPHSGQPALRRILPLSLTIDHRAVTGGEAARFLKAAIADLEGA